METESNRTIPCPKCTGPLRGDWTAVECDTCGNTLHPVTETRELIATTEVVRLARGGILVAVAA